MRINFQINELQAFIAVAEKSNFRAAADSLFISQPALSRRIEKLEAALDMRLLERTTRRVSLTDAGQQFLSHASAALEQLEAGVSGMTDRALQCSGRVAVACIPSVANHLLPAVLAEFARAHPHVRARVIDEGAGDVLASVVSGAADFGVNLIGAQETDIDFKPVYTERYVLAVPRGHRLAQRASVAWRELVDEPFVAVSRQSGNRMLIDHALARLAKRPSIAYEANHVAGALGLVGAGLGVAAVPGLALSRRTHPQLIGVPLTHPSIDRTLGLISRKGARLSPAVAALYDLLVRRLAG